MTSQLNDLIRPAATLRARRSGRASPARGRSTFRRVGVITTLEPRPALRAWTPRAPLGRSCPARIPATALRVPEMRHVSVRGTICGSSAAATEASVIANGTRISLRQVRAGDRAGMADLFARLTPRSRHQRFLSPKRELTASELTLFTDIDHLNHEAIAAVDQRDNSIVGVARYVRDADRAYVAEVAIEVADAFQTMGVGTALARLTIQRACSNGLTLLTARTLWENRAARELLRRHGFRARQSHGGEVDYELKLDELALVTVNPAPTSTRSPTRTPPAPWAVPA